MEVKLGISNRHVHLTQEDLETLFGKNYKLTKKNDLRQPGQFATVETVSLKTEKRTMENVRIIGPVRKYTQVEISKTDSYLLGLNPPIRESGDLEGNNLITIVGPMGSVSKNCCIIANRHIHITKEQLKEYNLENIEKVSIKINGEKSGIISDVYLKESDNSALELHLDTDDANAFLLKNGDMIEVINAD